MSFFEKTIFKRTLSALSAFAFMLFTMTAALPEGVAVRVFAETVNGSCGENLTWTLDTSTGELIIDGTGDMGFYGAGGQWRSYKNDIKTVKISDGVGSISGSAFYEFSNITSVTFSENASITKIEGSAFEGCSGLTSITIPNSVTSIDNSAFYGCSGLTSITLSDSVTIIDGHAFRDCSSLTSINIPNGVTTILNCAFSGCSSLKSITIPDSVKSISTNAFENCSSLTSIKIPDGVTSITNNTFSGCSSLTEITLPNSVTKILPCAFSGCSGLKGITIPDGVTVISDSAFEGCSGLTSITIPDSVTSIGGEAFKGCSGLTSITILAGVTTIGNSVFEGCSGLTSVIIPDGVTTIGDSAFEGCTGLTSVTIPNSVTTIGNSAFNGCSSLANVTIPNSVKTIGNYAFCNCNVITHLTIPDSVTSVGKDAFWACSNLELICAPANLNISSAISSTPAVIKYIVKENEVTITEITPKKDSTTVTIPEQINGYEVVFVAENERSKVDMTAHTKHKSGTANCTTKAVCGICGKEYGEPAGHTLTEVTAKEATCIETGIKAHWKCSVCGGLFTDNTGTTSMTESETVISAKGHSLDNIPPKAATETETGNTEYWKCSVCGRLFADSAGTTETTLDVVTIPINEHKHSFINWNSSDSEHWQVCACGVAGTRYPHNWSVEITKAATCTAVGTLTKTCRDCNNVVTEMIPMAEHTDDGGVITIPPTADTDGVKTHSCTVCGSFLSEEIIPALGSEHTHEAVGQWYSDATAHWRVCSCGEILDYSVHTDNGGVITVPSTEETDGVKTHSCTVCGYILGEEVIPAGTPEHIHDTNGQWYSDMSGHFRICSCGETLDYSAHTEDTRVIPPTPSSSGTITYYCTVCGYVTRTETIPPINIPSPPSQPSQPIQPTQPAIPVLPTQPEPEASEKPVNTPYIEGKNGKNGWEAISEEIISSPTGTGVTVDMNGTTILPADIVSDIAGKDIDLVLDMGGGVSWTINGKDVTAPQAVDMSVTADTKNIPVEIVNNVSGESYTIQISLAHNGEFGFKAVLAVDLGKENTGLYAALYYYDTDVDDLKLRSEKKVADDGTAEFTFIHASDYVIVINETPVITAADRIIYVIYAVLSKVSF